MADIKAYDLTDIRVEQATLLKSRVLPSCIYVTFLICNYSIILGVSGFGYGVAVWFATALAMVFVTYFYAKLKAPTGITRDNVDSYLKGHVLISSMTGIIWGGYAAYIMEWGSVLSILISTFLVCGITIGGMLPSSAYRPGYLGLATFALIPPAVCILIGTPWPLNLIGLAVGVYFTFGIITSKRGEQDLHESIFARNERERMAEIEAENTIVRRVNEEKSRFLAATSHDLSQPLHAQGYFIRALKEKLTQPDQIDLMQKIEQTWRRQGDFLRGLVDVNRLDSGAIVPKPETVNLKSHLVTLIDEFQAIADDRRIALKADLVETSVYTDPVLLNRVVRNLLSNALRYTPEGGNVELQLSQWDGCIELRVKDDGPGIPDDEKKRIFEEYVRLPDRGLAKGVGVGLGLSIVQRLTELLEYDLSLKSQVGVGSCFVLKIPVTVTDGALPTAKPAPDSLTQKHFASTPLVVLVDDDDAIREAMSSLLTDWGCQLISARNGKDALSLLTMTEETPVLLIIDRRLADGEIGSDLINLLREEVNETVPALLMSGEPDEPRQNVLGEGTVFMRKPVDPEAIYQQIQKVLSAHTA